LPGAYGTDSYGQCSYSGSDCADRPADFDHPGWSARLRIPDRSVLQRFAHVVRRRSPLGVVRRHCSQKSDQTRTNGPRNLWTTIEPGERDFGRDAGKCPLTRSQFEQHQRK
jgi:hypothetical protein